MYHWRAQQNKCNSMAERFTKRFTTQEEDDRNDRILYPVMPSPLGRYWLCYVNHRIKMLDDGMRAYTTRKYTRLGLDKHICSYRSIDQIAGMLVNYQPSIIFFGNGVTPPNAPIKIKKMWNAQVHENWTKHSNDVVTASWFRRMKISHRRRVERVTAAFLHGRSRTKSKIVTIVNGNKKRCCRPKL